MPIYEFRCRECETRFEALRPMGDRGDGLECPSCGAKAPEKQLSVFAASTKGSDASGACSRAPSCGSGFS